MVYAVMLSVERVQGRRTTSPRDADVAFGWVNLAAVLLAGRTHKHHTDINKAWFYML